MTQKIDPEQARQEIIDSFTRTLFVQAYATFVEQAKEDGEDTSDLPQAGPGEDWMDVAPETPESAVQAGLEGIAAIERRYGVPIEELVFIASEECRKAKCRTNRDHNTEAFGYFLAMQYVGHGVSWSDDHPMQLDLPHGEFNIGSREEAGLDPLEEDHLRWNPERENPRKHQPVGMRMLLLAGEPPSGKQDDSYLIEKRRPPSGLPRMVRRKPSGSAKTLVRHRLRGNPEGAEIPAFVRPAVAGYENFQAFTPREIGVLRGLVIPTQVCQVGSAVTTYYRSDKWENKKHDYFHNHDPGVKVGVTDGDGPMVAVPAEIAGKRDGIAIYKLGTCLGLEYETPDGERVEIKGRSPEIELYASASRKVLLVIDTAGSTAHVLAILWGGKMRVEDRGIVG